MNLNEIYDAPKKYMDASLCVNAEVENKAREAISELEKNCWRPAMDPEDTIPETDEDGYSKYHVLISFANADFLCIGQYIEKEDGGNFYDGDEDEKPLTEIGVIPNAWMPMIKPYRPWED